MLRGPCEGLHAQLQLAATHCTSDLGGTTVKPAAFGQSRRASSAELENVATFGGLCLSSAADDSSGSGAGALQRAGSGSGSGTALSGTLSGSVWNCSRGDKNLGEVDWGRGSLCRLRIGDGLMYPCWTTPPNLPRTSSAPTHGSAGGCASDGGSKKGQRCR